LKNKVLWSLLAEETYLGTLEYYQALASIAAEDLEERIVALTDRLQTLLTIAPITYIKQVSPHLNSE